MRFIKTHLATFLLATFVLGAAPASAGTVYNPNRLLHGLKNFYTLFKDKTDFCFIENGDVLEFYLAACDQAATKKPQQVFALSERGKSRLPADVAELKKQLLESGAVAAEQIAELEKLAKQDSVGRFVLAKVGNDTLPIGWISFDIETDGREHSHQILGLCSGPWSYVCQYDKAKKVFEISFRNYVYDEKEYQNVDKPRSKITRVLYSGVYARGNDDFVPYYYYNVKGTGDQATQNFPVTQEWRDALEPYVGNRLEAQREQVRTPRGEPNYLTALHPVYVLEVQNPDKSKETKLVFGGAVSYMKDSPATQSCEDDTGSYQLVDFDLFRDHLQAPFSGHDIEKLNVSSITREQTKTIQQIYDGGGAEGDEFDFATLPEILESKHFDLFNIATSTKIDADASENTFVIMKIDERGGQGTETTPQTEILRSNAVREYVEILKKPDGTVDVIVSAFNPNDYKNTNQVRADGKFWIKPEVLVDFWNGQKGFVGVSQPYQRALALQLKGFEKKSRAGVETREWYTLVSKMSNEILYHDYQINTIHAKSGLVGLYAQAFETFDTYSKKEFYDTNPMTRKIVPRVIANSMWVDSADLQKFTVSQIDPQVIQVYINETGRTSGDLVRGALERIAGSSDVTRAIGTEHQRAQDVSEQVSFVSSFFGTLNQMKENTENFNKALARAQALPAAKRPKYYTETIYHDDRSEEVKKPFNERMLKLMAGKSKLDHAAFVADIEKRLVELLDYERKWKDAEGPAKEEAKNDLLGRGRSMYLKIFEEKDFLELSFALDREVNKIQGK